LSADDQHILAKLNECIAACQDNLEKFRFNDYAKAIYEFMWHQFCDWYVEYSKQVFYGDDAARKATVLGVMHHCLSTALRLLHPLMPFVTEELWRGMGYAEANIEHRTSNTEHRTADSGTSIITAPWPTARAATELEKNGIESEAVKYVEARNEMLSACRTLRANNDVPLSQKVEFFFKPLDPQWIARLEADRPIFVSMAKISELTIDINFTPPPDKNMSSTITPLSAVYMNVAVDVAAEREKLTKQLAEVDRNLAGVQAKLGNENFVSRAPAAVIEQQRTLLATLTEKRTKLTHLLDLLKG
jgi:valyl-tRNA synthetase